jgi:hypothetical protein
MAQSDPSDYEGLMRLQQQAQDAQDEVDSLEGEWLELAERLGID